jgi:hypothetical protein
MKTYEDVISNTSTKDAPWLIVPANHKWYRDYIVSKAIVEAIKPYKGAWKKKLVAQGDIMKRELEEAHVHEGGNGKKSDPNGKEAKKAGKANQEELDQKSVD